MYDLCQTIEGDERSGIIAPTVPVVLNENYLRNKDSIKGCTGTLYTKGIFDGLGSSRCRMPHEV